MTSYANIESLGLAIDNQTFDSATSPIFKELIEELKPKTIIEVGSWKGVSALIMAELSGGHIHCVDTFLGSTEHFKTDSVPRDEWGASKLYHQFLTNVKGAGYAEKITPYQMTSTDGAKWLGHLGITAPLIFIDADHGLEGSYQDFRHYWPLLEEGGVMLIDDILVFPDIFASALRFSREMGIELETKAPFGLLRKSQLWPASYNLDRHHCRDVLAGCYDLPHEAKVILDLGANVGAFARFAKKRWPQAKVHCYEPHPVNYSLLKQTIDGYKLTDVWPHETAVSDCNSHRPLFDNGFNCGEHSLAQNVTTKGSVEVQTMDAADLPEADFIKMDIEGSELVVLGRLFQTNKLDAVQALVLEYHSANVIDDIEKMMRYCGFTMYEKKTYSTHRGLLKFLK